MLLHVTFSVQNIEGGVSSSCQCAEHSVPGSAQTCLTSRNDAHVIDCKQDPKTNVIHTICKAS